MTGWDGGTVGGITASRAPPAPDFIRRERLITELGEMSAVPLVLVVGGAGFGKTTAVSQWLRHDKRSTAWLTASAEHNDPVVLLADLVRVLDEFEPLEPRAKQRLAAVTIDFSSVILPRLEEAVSARGRPFVLVIDDAHRLQRRVVWHLMQSLVESVPVGSQVVLISRTEPELPLGRMRADRRVRTVTIGQLALNRVETGTLFEASGATLPEHVVDDLWQRTEGWPVAVYLATLAMRDAAPEDLIETASRFAGDDRLVVEYVREELLESLPRRLRTFLVHVSILDELDAHACDALLERDDSARFLEDAARSMPLLMPIDRSNSSFRMHQLMRDSLRLLLSRQDPGLSVRLHERAAHWYASVGQLDRAVQHLLLTDDPDAIDGAIWRAAPVFVATGRTATVSRWLERFSAEQRATRPALAVTQAWCALTDGDMASLGYWTSVASDMDERLVLPDGNSVAAAAALLRAVEGLGGVDRTRANARLAYDLDRVRSPFRAIARYIEGAALRVEGRRDEARQRLEEAETLAVPLPAIRTLCLAQRAALAVDEDDVDTADHLVHQFSELVDQFGIGERPAQGAGFAVTAFVHARTGETVQARAAAKHASFLISMLTTVAPWVSIDARMFLARALVLLGDVNLAHAVVHEAVQYLPLVPDRYLLDPRVSEMDATTAAETVPLGVMAAPITPAELRVLRYLPTHLTFSAIADELFVSRNTVKTQAIAIYRKLGVSTRDRAVQSAQSLGLLEH